MEKKKILPVGIDDFRKIREQNFYYLDKTSFISDLVNSQGMANLLTRPRRFGKTLILSTLKHFFEIDGEPELFEGLEITKDKVICEKYQGKFPVIFLSLKSVEGECYEEAIRKMAEIISFEAMRKEFLIHDEKINAKDKERLKKLIHVEADEITLQFSLALFMRMLHIHYGKQVILLIDEYDVPLEKSGQNGYYKRMVSFLRTFFGEAFKTNPDMYMAVVTGCLRVSKESIFTGVNNLKADSISDVRFGEYFGFTDKDVKKVLADYDLNDAYECMKEWYDGYHFGSTNVYCPWDVLCHCDKLLSDKKAKPQAYWNNTSSNEIVKRFVNKADATTRDAIERLIAGESVEVQLTENLTYDELSESIENLWSVLYLTGYLTIDRERESEEVGKVYLSIPNKEVRMIFIEKIKKWFEEKRVPENQNEIYTDLWNRDIEALQEKLSTILMDTISYYDYHENYYHAFLAGMLLAPNYRVRSNKESGTGRSDIIIEDGRNRRVIIIEVKRSKRYEDMDADSKNAIEQIKKHRYAQPYLNRKYEAYIYGIAFYKKDVAVCGYPVNNNGF